MPQNGLNGNYGPPLFLLVHSNGSKYTAIIIQTQKELLFARSFCGREPSGIIRP
jgi:hypothetical protein